MPGFSLAENRGNPEDGTGIFTKINQKAIAFLESLTAVEKAMCVPYLKIWQVNPRDGKPAYPNPQDKTQPFRPLTTQTVEPPPFSAVGDFKARERPVVSLEKVVLSTNALLGRYQIFKVGLDLVVHRPDALSTPPKDKDDWSATIIPGNVFAMEYGWKGNGVKNKLFNGEGIQEGDIVIPGTRTVYFAVTNYNFDIQPNLEIKLHITAYETGLLNLRKINLGEKATFLDPTKLLPEFKFTTVEKEALKNFYGTPEGKALLAKFGQDLKNKIYKDGAKIKFNTILNYFGETIEEGLKEVGYKKVILKFGKFNGKVGNTNSKYSHKNYNNQSIGDFEFPREDVQKIFEDGKKAGKALTVFNFLEIFLAKINHTSTWSTKNAQKRKDNSFNQTTPDLFVKIVPAGSGIGIYIIDAKSEFINFTEDYQKKNYLGPKATQEEIRNLLIGKAIPYISFQNGNSYIKESKFNVITDDKMKAHLIQTYYGAVQNGNDKRKQKGRPDKANKIEAVDPSAFLYSGAIQGDVTMLGNFAFDMFSLMWIDFEVNRWSGTFNVRAREDTISKEGFFTKVSFIANGSDVFGTQGSRKPPVSTSVPGQVDAVEPDVNLSGIVRR